MGKLIFAFGDQCDNFEETSRPFIEAAGCRSATIAVLTEGGDKSEQYATRITAPWRNDGVEVVIVGPQEYAGEPTEQMAESMRQCTGIFMCGGMTRTYQKIYAASMLAEVIRELYSTGIPYAGVSAGASPAAEECPTWGGIVTTPTNEYYVRFRGCYNGVEGSIQLELGQGLGLLHNCIIEPHFSEMGGFPRLITAMEWTGISNGYGLDSPTCLEFENGVPTEVLGRGRLYRLRRGSSRKFDVDVYEPGERLHK